MTRAPRDGAVSMSRVVIISCGVLLAACSKEYHPEYHPQSQYDVSQNISYPTTIFQTTGRVAGSEPPFSAPSATGRADPAHVLVLQTSHLDRPAQVVGVVDAHEDMGKHDAALQTLRMKAAQLGADAVVGVEFHHGESEGAPTHLSGLAVRFLPAVSYPVD